MGLIFLAIFAVVLIASFLWGLVRGVAKMRLRVASILLSFVLALVTTAVAKNLIDRGFDVLYETAQNLFGDFEDEKFNRAYNTGVEERKTDRYFSCDLLIIDDLGAELSNQFTASCLYNLINTRYNMGKSCIISTNLTHPEIEKRYSQRVLSRLLGQYQNLQFTGRDIRMMKKLVQ